MPLSFTDLRQGSFSLDQDAAAWLRTGGDRSSSTPAGSITGSPEGLRHR
jgi:hypothetical protein